MKYVVAKGNCFYNDGNIYDAGDVITKSIFKPESAFDDAVSKGKIIAVEEKADEKKESGKADEVKTDEVKTDEAAADENKKEQETEKKSGSKKGGK